MEEKLSNKTCGECKYYCNDAAFCSHRGVGWKKKTDMICKDFEPIPKPTNGDVIRQMSNRELAVKLSIHAMCDTCPAKTKECGGGYQPGGYCHEHCLNSWREWLNAPADCVKQNGNDDTQADLCKADNTESEGEDEIN